MSIVLRVPPEIYVMQTEQLIAAPRVEMFNKKCSAVEYLETDAALCCVISLRVFFFRPPLRVAARGRGQERVPCPEQSRRGPQGGAPGQGGAERLRAGRGRAQRKAAQRSAGGRRRRRAAAESGGELLSVLP